MVQSSKSHEISSSSSQSEAGSTSLGQSQKRRAGRKKFKETRHPIFKGVRTRKGKWVSEVREPNKKSRIWLGTFSYPGMAAKAYDVAALALRGDAASLNFPESARTLPRPKSLSVKDIQIAAMEAAETFIEDKTSPDSVSEDEVFNMPGILESMAEGLMITPPSMQKGYYPDDDDDDGNDYVEVNLWGD
ncbi:hypothetical protein V6Z12_1Z012700 [Gossypium hirsutum]